MNPQARALAGSRPSDRSSIRRNSRAVAIWLLVICGMVLVTVVLGGATRITGSGLSIMEWAPLTGALPPMTDREWERLFALYQQIPQYRLLNHDFTLAEFRGIFWLEWVHRLWGRLIGIAFLGPFLWFWATGQFDGRLWLRLSVIFVLGGLQGAIGWFMVASGFFPESTAVSPYRLVIHLALALFLYAALVWTALCVLWPVPPRPAARRMLHRLGWLSCCSIAVTMLAGGFVAGTHAGFDYNTFPLMDGRLVPQGYAALEPFIRNLTENIPAVQFDHRLLASFTLLVVAVTLGFGLLTKPSQPARIAVITLGAAAAVQYLVGVATLIMVVPISLAALHQAVAALLLTTAIVLVHVTRAAPTRRMP